MKTLYLASLLLVVATIGCSTPTGNLTNAQKAFPKYEIVATTNTYILRTKTGEVFEANQLYNTVGDKPEDYTITKIFTSNFNPVNSDYK